MPGRSERKRPGGGRLHVLQRAATTWKSIGCIKLPRSVKFADYSAIALRNSRIAVISQETARLWIGTLRFHRLDDRRRRRRLRLSGDEERKTEILHAGRSVLAVEHHVRDGFRPQQARSLESLQQTRPVDSHFSPLAPTERSPGKRPSRVECAGNTSHRRIVNLRRRRSPCVRRLLRPFWQLSSPRWSSPSSPRRRPRQPPRLRHLRPSSPMRKWSIFCCTQK